MSFKRRTKIICTIGPATSSTEKLEQLILTGMNIARLNMSHSSHAEIESIIKNIRNLCAEHEKTVGILMDLQGPAIRTGDLSDNIILKVGDIISLAVKNEKSPEHITIPVNYDDFISDLNDTDKIILDNGNIHLRVLKKYRNHVDCEVLTDGILGNRKHINLPGVKVNLPALTEKDLADIEKGIEYGVDFFAMSFLRKAEDVSRLKGILEQRRAPQKIIGKLENQEGYQNLEEIIEVVDGIMIARGDLGIEVPFEDLPPMQRKIVKSCLRRGCPVIVATHMLESMIEYPSPTRAEVTDIANAVFEQASAIMLSGETSVGKYPVQCVDVMNKIALRIERSGGAGYGNDVKLITIRSKLTRSAVDLANKIEAKAIILFTRKGTMALNTARARPLKTPIYAFTDNRVIANQLTLLWGTTPFLIDFNEDTATTVETALDFLKKRKLIDYNDRIVVLSEMKTRGKIIDTIQIEEID